MAINENKIKGSIIQLEKDKTRGKCRKWKLIIYLGRDPLTKKHQQKCKRFSGTYSEAKSKLAEMIDAAEKDSDEVKPLHRKAYTFKEYADHWADLRESSGKVAPGTVKRDRDKLKSLAFLIGDMRLADVSPAVLENAYLDLRQGKSKSGKRLSGTYVSDINKKVSLMMDHAKKNGYIKENPCKKADVPKIDTPEKRALPAAQIASLIDSLTPTEPMECGVLLCAALGLRRGEAVGLSWGDVDFEERAVYVRHSYDDAGNLNVPKTKASNRVLPMPEIVFDALQQRQKIQIAFFSNYATDLIEKDDDGHVVGLTASAPIISDPWGNRIHPSGLGHWWYKRRADFGLEGWRLHDLRHSFLTVAAQQGVHPSVMQKLAGHSTSRITMDVYTHANLEDKRKAMDSMQEAFTKYEDGESSESTKVA